MHLKKRITPDRIIGLIFILLGIASFIEGLRLRPLRMLGGSVGDDTLPLLFGIIMLSLGVLKVFIAEDTSAKTRLPKGSVLHKMGWTMLLLFLYLAGINTLGYPPATLLCAFCLFKIFGSYRWYVCLLASVLLTAAMYVVFIHFLNMPFPVGIFID